MEFSEKLVILRKQRNLTQADFAKEVKVTRQAVYKWESGQSYPGAMTLLEMKRLFGVSVDDLLDPAYTVEAVRADAPKAEPVKAEPVKAEPVKAEPVKVEPVKEEAPKAEPVAVGAEEKPQAAEPAAPAAVEQPAPEKKPEEKVKKKGFFARLFG